MRHLKTLGLLRSGLAAVVLALSLSACVTPPPPPTVFGEIPAPLRASWMGTLSVMGQSLPLVLHLEQSPTMDSPAQGAFDMPVQAGFDGHNLVVVDTALAVRLELSPSADSRHLSGTFSQQGFTTRLEMDVTTREASRPQRPQTPVPPFAYDLQDVTIASKVAGVTLAATVTTPRFGVRAVVVLIGGSGPNNRDEEILGHKPFWVLADELTRQGFAVVRFDKRGVGASTGNYATATTADFAEDVEGVLTWSRQHFPGRQVGTAGHSEGGLISPMVQQKYASQDFLILLAGPGVPITKLMTQQRVDISRQSGMSSASIADNERLNSQLEALLTQEPNDAAFLDKAMALTQGQLGLFPSAEQLAGLRANLGALASPWYRSFIKIDPQLALRTVRVPVLALNGETDLQVAAGPNLEAIALALNTAGNSDVTIAKLPGLNHLFQPSASGSPNDYATIETTFDRSALTEITRWLTSRYPATVQK